MKTGKLAIYTEKYEFQTEGVEIDLVDLTPALTDVIQRSNIQEGRITVFVIGSIAAVFTTEYEPYLIEDTKDILQELITSSRDYQHDSIEENTHAHLRSTLLGPELTIPIVDGKLMLSSWQQVVYADFDDRPRNRTVGLQIMGIAPEL